MVYVFDKDFYLQTVDVEGCEFSTTVKEALGDRVGTGLLVIFHFSIFEVIRIHT